MGGGAAAQIGLSQPERWDFVGIWARHSWTFKALLHDPTRLDGRLLLTGVLETLHAQGHDLDSEAAFCGLHTERSLQNLKPERTVVPMEWLDPSAQPSGNMSATIIIGGEAQRAGAEQATAVILWSVRSRIFSKPTEARFTNSIPRSSGLHSGVTTEWLSMSHSERCANPIINHNFFNAEYNRKVSTLSLPFATVITVIRIRVKKQCGRV